MRDLFASKTGFQAAMRAVGWMAGLAPYLITGLLWALARAEIPGGLGSASPVVGLDGLGEVRGSVARARDDSLYYQFRGLPYAAPPTGELRWASVQHGWLHG